MTISEKNHVPDGVSKSVRLYLESVDCKSWPNDLSPKLISLKTKKGCLKLDVVNTNISYLLVVKQKEGLAFFVLIIDYFSNKTIENASRVSICGIWMCNSSSLPCLTNLLLLSLALLSPSVQHSFEAVFWNMAHPYFTLRMTQSTIWLYVSQTQGL